MANTTKKYVSLEKLGLYDDKIKGYIGTADEAVLNAAKAYADGLAPNYDAAGAAATVQGNLDTEIARAKAAEEANAAAAKQAQDEVDALEVVVAGMYTNAKIDELIEAAQTEATYDDTEVKADIEANADAIAKEITDRENAVKAVQDAVDALAGTHTTDKETLEGKIKDAQDAADAAQADVDALEQTHTTDKAALEAAIALKADQTALDELANAAATKVALKAEEDRAKEEEARIEGLVTAEAAKAREEEGKLDARLVEVETFFKTAEGETLDEALDTLVELQTYLETEGAIADQMLLDIAANAKSITDMDAAYKAADETLQGNIDDLADVVATKADAEDVEAIDGRVEVVEGKVTTLEGKVATLEGEMDDVQAAVATKVETEAFNEKVEELEAADEAMAGRLDDIEAVLGSGEGSVAEQIATAKQEAIDAAAADATAKDEALEAKIKEYVDAEDAKIEKAVEDLTAVVDTKAAQADLEAAVGRVATLETDMAQAKTDITAIDGRVTANETAIGNIQTECATKATKVELQAEIDRATAKEAELAAAINAYVECSEEEIVALFN